MYETKEVKATVPEVIRNALWIALDNLDNPGFNHRFDLHSVQKNGKPYQRIIHTQKDSAYRKEHRFELPDPIDDMTVYIIGFGTDGWLMLLPP